MGRGTSVAGGGVGGAGARYPSTMLRMVPLPTSCPRREELLLPHPGLGDLEAAGELDQGFGDLLGRLVGDVEEALAGEPVEGAGAAAGVGPDPVADGAFEQFLIISRVP